MSVGAVFPEGVFPAGLFSGFPLYESSTVYDAIRYYWEENQVYQQNVGTSAKWPFQVLDALNQVVPVLVAPLVSVCLNGDRDNISTESFTISAYNATLATYTIEVPDALDGVDFVHGDTLEIAINDAGGRGHLTIQYVSNEVTGTSTGSEQVIPAANYTLNKTAKTITLTSPYNTTTVEQVLRIQDITTGDLIYDSENPTKHSISVATGVITYTYDSVGIANTDKIQIRVNKV